jgi:Fe-S-cluster containining protein
LINQERGSAGLAHRPQNGAPPLVPGRSCGSCSLCCKLYPVRELSKPAGQWCVHSARGEGCADHTNRPQACRQFFCSWLTEASLGPEWKPETARFVLAADPLHQALTVMVDPGMPSAWKREPYYSRLRELSERLFGEDRRLLVNVRGRITVVLPDRDVPLGVPPRGAEIAIWREGSAYGAKLQPPRDELALLKPAFIEAFEQASSIFDDPAVDDLAALMSITRDRNKMLDETAAAYAEAAGAECRAGCASCCHLMVMATPFEVLAIARQLLETQPSARIEDIKQRLRRLAEVPLDSTMRAQAKVPCALLENGRCSVYEQRPSVCRVMLSQSRAACESCLQGAGGIIPYIEPPSKIAAAAQMGIDYALISRRKLPIDLVELSRALLIALSDSQGALKSWLAGEDPFSGARAEARGASPGGEKAMSAARRFGVARHGEG